MLLGLGVWGVVGLAWSPSWVLGLGELVQLAALELLICCEVELEGVFLGLALGLGVSAGLCLVQMLGYSPVQEIASPAGLFMNRDVLAELAAILLVWEISRRKRLWVLGVTGVPLVLCQSRVALGMVLAGVMVGEGWWRKWWVWAGGAGALGVLWMLPGKGLSAMGRVEGWKLGWELGSWKGLGLGFFEYVSPSMQLVHSDLGRWWDELGIVGLVGVGIWAAGRRWEREDWGLLAATGLGLLVAFPLEMPANAACVALVLGRSRPRCWRWGDWRRGGGEVDLERSNSGSDGGEGGGRELVGLG